MKKFQVHFSGHTAIDVEAKNAEQAEQKAQDIMDKYLNLVKEHDALVSWDIEMNEADDVTEDEE